MRKLVMAFALLFVSSVAFADNWPEWRGPHGDGRCDEEGLPVTWSATDNVAWKVNLPTAGNSTPIVWEDRLFLTQPGKAPNQRSLVCISRRDGQVLWERSAEWAGEDPTHGTNPVCSSSAATNGRVVIAWFGSAGLHAWDLNGTPLWHRDLGVQKHIWGYGSSPVIRNDICYLNFGPGDRSFLIAVSASTGETLWEHQEPLDTDGTAEAGFQSADYTGSWSTPFHCHLEGRDQLLLSVPFRLRSFDPVTGREIWNSEGTNALSYTSPIVGDGLVIAMGGYNGMTIAVKADGTGDVTASHRVWRHAKTRQRIGSGVIHDGHIYIHNDPGIAECFDLKTGELKWEQRLTGTSDKNTNWSSLVLADGVCYSMTQGGDCWVFRASPTFGLISRNSLGESSNSSVAASNGQLFLRTHQSLWCIGKTASGNQ